MERRLKPFKSQEGRAPRHVRNHSRNKSRKSWRCPRRDLFRGLCDPLRGNARSTRRIAVGYFRPLACRSSFPPDCCSSLRPLGPPSHRSWLACSPQPLGRRICHTWPFLPAFGRIRVTRPMLLPTSLRYQFALSSPRAFARKSV